MTTKDLALGAQKLGLSLSGGGYRAAAFHLGVMDVLNEQRILDNVRVLSTVSGGSIIGAVYCTQPGDYEEFRSEMRKILSHKTVLPGIFSSVLKIAWGAALRPTLQLQPLFSVDALKRNYDKIFGGRTLRQLIGSPKRPQLIINTTNLVTGNDWVFSSQHMGDMKGPDDQDWRKRAQVAGDYELATAVAASCAFPGAFAPIELPQELLHEARTFLLSDGGIFDNQGVTALEAEGCDYVLVSDGSVPFATIAEPRADVIGLALRSIEIAGQVLRSRHLASAKGAVFEIGVQEDEKSDLADTVQQVGTNLKRIPEQRLNLIVARGTQVAQATLAQEPDKEKLAALEKDRAQQLIRVTPNQGRGMKPTSQGTTVWEIYAYLDVETTDQGRPLRNCRIKLLELEHYLEWTDKDKEAVVGRWDRDSFYQGQTYFFSWSGRPDTVDAIEVSSGARATIAKLVGTIPEWTTTKGAVGHLFHGDEYHLIVEVTADNSLPLTKEYWLQMLGGNQPIIEEWDANPRSGLGATDSPLQ